MRYLSTLCAVVILAACGGSVARNAAQMTSRDQIIAGQSQEASIDSVVQFLLTSAVTDFRTHHPPNPIRFREVRLRQFLNPDGKKQYMLCGQFLPAQGGGEAEWVPFATIKTSGYEQWIGAQAAAFCKGSSVAGEQVDDLSSALKDRYDSLR